MNLKQFPFYKQLDSVDCGPTCLRIIAKYYGKSFTLETLRQKAQITKEGASFYTLSEAAENIGFRTLAVRTDYNTLLNEVPLPCIAHWKQNHFVVVYKVTKDKIYISDPAHGRITYKKEEFLKHWASMANDEGFLLLFETTPEFNKNEDQDDEKKIGLKYFISYFLKYKKFIGQILLGFLVTSILGLITPFLTQSMVDKGILNQDIGFVNIILIAQLVLTLSQTSVNFIQSWISLHLNTRINVSILSDYLLKLMKLPMVFFDVKNIGDIMQRLSDHTRVKAFLESSTIGSLFSMINLIVYGVIMAYYNVYLLMIFVIGHTFYVLWIVAFLKIRKDLDYKNFHLASDNQNKLIQVIQGIQTLKLHNAERQKRWEWERIQARLFKLSVKSLTVSQAQNIGSVVISQTMNIILSFIVAKQVIDGQLTLGTMMAVQFIIGQLNAPVSHFLQLITEAQDAKISLERIGEIHNKEDEEEPNAQRIISIPQGQPLKLKNISFKYEGAVDEYALKDVTLEIPEGKITAIVGTSGSGKTTLVKLLLRYYKPTSGEVLLGNVNIDNYHSAYWRGRCGVVMQDAQIFSDTIARNVALGDERMDVEKVYKSVEVANIKEFIEELPLAYNTKIGSDGHGLSLGQRQRILIARAVYKSPDYIFFDEATNALDSNNESVIMKNLNEFFKGRTVVVVAHRLSTVKNADQIIVLEKGSIVEKGTHKELVALKGKYFELVKNQLELGA